MKWLSVKRIVLFCLLVGFFMLVWRIRNSNALNAEPFFAFLRYHPFLAPIVYIAVYALMVTCLIPTLPMNLGAGFLWGVWLGGPIAALGAVLGASLAFLVSRYVAHDYINRKFTHSAWIKFKGVIEKSDWKVVAFMRANPAFPFGVVSYFLGLTPLTFRRHFWTTFLSIIPGSFVFAAVGHSIGGIVLGDAGSRIMRDVVVASIALVLLVVGQWTVKDYLQKSAPTFPSDPGLPS